MARSYALEFAEKALQHNLELTEALRSGDMKRVRELGERANKALADHKKHQVTGLSAAAETFLLYALEEEEI